MVAIDINLDCGESFGRFRLGNDEEVLKFVTSANIACGFHAGDPSVMRRTVRLAKDLGVQVGSHPGLPDLLGFGRREIQVTPDEVHDYVVYQTGALQAFLRAEGMKLQHVKAHGIFYKMIDRDEALAEAYIRAVREMASDAIIVTEMATHTYDKARKAGVRVVTEAFPDLKYGADGRWIIEKTKEPRRPEEVVERAVMIAREGKVKTIEGTVIPVQAQTICLHGDAPNAPDIAKAVSAALRGAGVELLPMAQLV